MMIKKCFIDVETTGLNPQKHGVHQVASIITDDDGNELDRINLCFAPDNVPIEYSALEKCGLTIQDLESRELTSARAFQQFIDFLSDHVNQFDKNDKLQFVSYNTNFDEQFIRAWFDRNANSYYGSFFWNPSICIMKTVAWFFRNKRNVLPSFKLGAICQFANIEFDDDNAHDGLYDIQKTLELYRKLI